MAEATPNVNAEDLTDELIETRAAPVGIRYLDHRPQKESFVNSALI